MRETNVSSDFGQDQLIIGMRGALLRRLSPAVSILLLLLIWQLVTAREWISPILVPPPADVLASFAAALADGTLPLHTLTTLGEMFYGLLLGVGIGLAFGYAIAKAPLLEHVLAPIIVGFQATPIVAYAPLLIIVFGTGPASKVATTAVIVFFPTLVNTIAGLRAVAPNLRDVMRSLNARSWQIFRHLELPSALPLLLAGLKTSTTLAVIGAVVGEFVNPQSGLGYLVTAARNRYDTPLVFVSILTMTAIALSLYSMVAYLEWRCLAWRRAAT